MGGCRAVSRSLPKVSVSDPPWLQLTDRRKQTSSGFNPGSALNVKWTAGDEAGPWGSLSQDEIHLQKTLRKSQSNTRLFQTQNNTTRGSGLIPHCCECMTAIHTKKRPWGFAWTFLSEPLWQSLEHHLMSWEKTSVWKASPDNTTFPFQLHQGRWLEQISMCRLPTIKNTRHIKALRCPQRRDRYSGLNSNWTNKVTHHLNSREPHTDQFACYFKANADVMTPASFNSP